MLYNSTENFVFQFDSIFAGRFFDDLCGYYQECKDVQKSISGGNTVDSFRFITYNKNKKEMIC